MGQVTTTKYMFSNAAAFNQPVGAWNMAKVTTTWVRRSPSNHTQATNGEGCAGRADVLRRRVHGTVAANVSRRDLLRPTGGGVEHG